MHRMSISLTNHLWVMDSGAGVQGAGGGPLQERTSKSTSAFGVQGQRPGAGVQGAGGGPLQSKKGRSTLRVRMCMANAKRSFATPARRALLQKRAHAFLRIL